MNRFRFLCYAIVYKILQFKNKKENIWEQAPLAILAGDDIGLHISLFGQFESDILHLLETEFFAEAEQGICIDIGANIGNHARAFSPHFEKVYAFEPNPLTFALLNFNVKTFSNIETFAIAVSDKSKKQSFSVDMLNSGKSKLTASSDHETSDVIVNTTTLDEFMAAKKSRISFIKLDVEGHEPRVLQGAKHCIKTHKPMIMMELLEEQINDNTSATLTFLQNCGYTEFWYASNYSYMSYKLIRLARKWRFYLILQTFLILICGKSKPKLTRLNPSQILPMNYDAIIAR